MTLDDLKKLSPAWWGAIAGAMAAGATLVPEHRLLGGLVGGGAMLLVARKLSAPCCAACAEAAAGASSGPADSSSTDRPPLFAGAPSDDIGAYTSPTLSSNCSSCSGGTAPHPAPHPAASTDDGTIFDPIRVLGGFRAPTPERALS